MLAEAPAAAIVSDETAEPRATAGDRRHRVLGWAGPIAAAMIGAVLRLWHLEQPHALVFDETYYAKEALSLLRFGVEKATGDGANDLLLRNPSAPIFTDSPEYVVHPPVGKWLIATGEWAFGADPFGWRIAAAVAGTLCILLLGRVVLRLTGNVLLATLAAGFLALDGLAIVLSRTALLDGFLTLFVLAAFSMLLLDRDRTRERYRDRPPSGGLLSGLRWRRVGAGALMGLACGVKWSGLWYLAAFLALTVCWEVTSRRTAGSTQPWRAVLTSDVLGAAVSLVAVAVGFYLLTWTGWFLSDDGWGRTYSDATWLPQPLQALWHYHQAMYSFHVGLDQDHPYRASAWGWLLQARPTSFYYDSSSTICGAEKCSSAITALGNPAIWWAAVPAFIHQGYRAVMVRDGRSAAVVVGVLAGWAPWLFYPERTTFSFYSVVFLPFLIAALTLSLGQVLGRGPVAQRQWRIVLVGGYVLIVVLATWWFFPVWTGEVIDYQAWRMRMWWPSWI